MATLNSSWQKVSEVYKAITSNTSGYMRLYMRAVEGSYNGNTGHTVYAEFRIYTSNPYGRWETSQWGGASWSISYGGAGASGDYGGFSHYSNDPEITVVSTSFFVPHGAAYTGNERSNIYFYNGDVYPNADSITLTARNYTVSYDANGGTGAPSSQIKSPGTNLTLSDIIPSKTSSTANSYTVTFDAGEGGSEYDTYTPFDVTTYSFRLWNTKANGSGAGYQPGGVYSEDASTILYAIWDSSTIKGKVILPSAERGNYSFLGWTRDTTTNILVTEDYVPVKDETLYAVWEVLVPDNPYTTSTALDNLEITSTSTSDITPFTGTISCVATLPIVRQLLYSFSNDNGTTWTNYQSSNSYNFTGLHEETEYTCRIRVKAVHQGVDSEDLIVISNPFTFTTLADQAKVRGMRNGQWVKGKGFGLYNGNWVKAKKIYILTNGQWKININNE